LRSAHAGDDLTNGLAKTREVVLFDNAGVAASSGETPSSFQEMGTNAIAFIRALGLTQVDVLGFSIGGMVSQEIALQAPYLVRRLVLVGTSAAAESEEGTRALRGISETWSQVGPAPELLDGMSQAVMSGGSIGDKWKQFWATFDAPDVTRNVEAMVTRDDLMSRLGELTMPALVMTRSFFLSRLKPAMPTDFASSCNSVSVFASRSPMFKLSSAIRATSSLVSMGVLLLHRTREERRGATTRQTG